MIEFLERAKKFSKRTAIVSGQAEYNYDQLLRKSNSIASSLLNNKIDL